MPYTIRTGARASLAVLFSLFIIVSCTMNQTIAIKNDGSGTLVMHAEVSKLLHDYIASLAEVSGKTDVMKGGKVFDAASIRKDFESRPGITVKKAVTPTPDSLDLELAFTSLQDVFARDAKLKSTGAFVYSESGGVKSVKLHLDRTNYTQLSSLFPLLNDPVFAELGPQVNDTITDDEYLEMIRFSIGDDGPGLLKKSFITLTIDPEGEIVSQSGGTISGGAVAFRIPLLRLLVLDKPLDYLVTFK
ncbi:MAG: hypothetical protein ABSF77_02480 [Spirochaetia bacterium]|jgi:hypothetical protein